MNAPDPIRTAPIVPVLDSGGDGPALFLHVAIFLEDNTVLDDSIFRLVSVQGQESVSEPFEFRLELHANDQWMSDGIFTANHFVTQGGWSFDALLGRAVTFAISTPQPTADAVTPAVEPLTDCQTSSQLFSKAVASGSQPAPACGYNMSFFNGIVAGVSVGGPGVYQVTVRPSLWLLTLSNRYVLHPQCSVQGAIASALLNYSIQADYSALDATAVGQTQDWLQAGESDYHFVRRMMSKAHLLYYFRHTPISHQVVFLNTPSYPHEVPFVGPMQYVYVDQTPLGLHPWTVISNLHYEQSLAAGTVNGSFVAQGEAWQGDVPMYNQSISTYSGSAAADTAGVPTVDLYKVYQYGCAQGTADDFTKKTLSASNAASRRLSGTAYCSMFRTGHTFKIHALTWAGGGVPTSQWSEESSPSYSPTVVRPDLDGRQFVLTRVEHQANQNGEYSNSFEASIADNLVCGFNLEDSQQSSVLAVVVDGSGRSQASGYKFQQDSDFSPTNETCEGVDSLADQSLSGVYVVLANAWPDGPQIFVKLAAYMQSAPSIGSLVLVGRSSDETELPELQQVVHATGNKAVTPDGWTASTSLGSLYSTHYGDGISLGFGRSSSPNLGGAVKITSTAYNYTSATPSPYFKDVSYSQGATYNYSTSEVTAATPSQDLQTTLGLNDANPQIKSLYSQATDLLNVSESFGSAFSRSTGKVQSTISKVGSSYNNNTVSGPSVSVAMHSGDVSTSTTITANNTSTTTIVGTDTNTSTHRGNVISNSTITGNSTNTSVITGNNTTTTQVTGTETNTVVHIGDVSNTSSVTGTSTNTNTIGGKDTSTINYNGGNSNTTTVSGDSYSSSTTTGTQTSHNRAGVSDSVNMTGISKSLHLSGSDSSLQLVGNSNSLRVTAETNEIALLGAGVSVSLSGAVLETKTALLSIEMPVTLKIVL